MLLTAFSLLIRVDGYWLVSPEVGKKIDLLTGLRAKVGKADPLLPPVQGWEYLAVVGKWNSDPTMECSREVLPASLDSVVKKKKEEERRKKEEERKFYTQKCVNLRKKLPHDKIT